MKFKFFKISILCALMPSLALAQTNITITGKVDPSHNGEKVTLIHGSSLSKIAIDTDRVTNGSIVFHILNTEPQVANITIGKNRATDHVSIFLAKGDITITVPDSLKNAVITGDKLSEDYSRMTAPIVKLQQQQYYYMAKLGALPADKKQSEEGLAINAQIQDVKLRITAATYAAIDANPNSYIALYMLKSLSGTVVYDVVMPHFSKLSSELRNSAEGKALEQKILLVKDLRSGLTAKDFESTTPEGKKLSLHEIMATGKYTLIDFWASWCVPCRAENPNVVKAYNAYHTKGLNILSVSLDTKADNWKAAIVKDGMPWNHVSTLIGFKEQAAILYGIQAIPQNVLVDAHGVIVASNLRGEALMEKLKQLL